ncbi:MAG TPA: sugar phosphate isomerase/epimerase [Candidatus Hydrogenedentes bacterium]|nr:sugar phosphate isomerase/epimerase [Candidatus Hydrogenedentota bacterium]
MTRRGFVGTMTAAGAMGLAAGEARAAQKPPLDVRFGLNLLVYTAAFTKAELDLVPKVADFGYDGVEILFGDLDILAPAETRKACEAAGMGMTACAVMTSGENISSPDADVRKSGVARLKRIVDITAEMGGDAVGGPLYAPVRELTGKPRTDDEWKWAAEGLRAAAEHAERTGIILAIEPLNRFETHVINTVLDGAKLVREVDHPNLKIQVDTFHANIEDKDTAAAIREAGSAVGHFHASESDRGVPGTGQVRWKECFSALRDINYTGWVTIESFATGIVDLCAAACIWRPIYDSADGLAKDGLAFLKAMARVA